MFFTKSDLKGYCTKKKKKKEKRKSFGIYFSIIILAFLELFYFQRSEILFIFFFSFFRTQSHALYQVENVLKLLRQSTRSLRFIILS